MSDQTQQPNVFKIVAPYAKPSIAKSLFQIANTLIPLAGLCYLMYLSLEISYLLTLALSFITGFLIVRVFIIQHDCGHGSFFKNELYNKIVGRSLSGITMTPYNQWAKEHNVHHATSGNLDKRGTGDVDILTVNEYLQKSPFKRFIYRIYRNPFFLFTFGAYFHFLIKQRFAFFKPKRLSSWMSVLFTDLYLIAIISGFSYLIGVENFLKIYLPTTFFAASIGTWIFYMQHQHEGTYWEHQDNWVFQNAALQGSCYYKLPKILQWFSGNIGFHHIHHLSSKIPNYNLEKCYKENPSLQENVVIVTLLESLKCVHSALWDEKSKRIISFRDLKNYQAA